MKKILSLLLLSAMLFSCSKDDEPKLMVNTENVSLYSRDSHHITTTNGTNVKFKSQNPYIATVNETTGEVTAMTIGYTIIEVSSDQGRVQVGVTVKSKYNTFVEPCRDFTKTKSQIISMYGTPDSQTGNTIGYVYENGKAHLADMYTFENDRLSGSAAIIHQDYAVEAMYFLAERYLPIGSQDGMYMFVNGHSKDKITMAVTLTKVQGYKLYYVTYMPYTFDTRSCINNRNFDEKVLDKLVMYKE